MATDPTNPYGLTYPLTFTATDGQSYSLMYHNGDIAFVKTGDDLFNSINIGDALYDQLGPQAAAAQSGVSASAAPAATATAQASGMGGKIALAIGALALVWFLMRKK